MRIEDLKTIYKESTICKSVSDRFQAGNASKIVVKGLQRSLDALFVAGLYKRHPEQTMFLVFDDREEATAFQSDLQSLLKEKETLFFPLSYKKPYDFHEVDNANILQRTEVLDSLNDKSGEGKIIISYPDALCEKVINKRSLVKNSYGIKEGEELDTTFLSEFLIEYGFVKADFVYEAGEFAIRGGIVDIFSFANDLPYRIELLGKEVETIRTFNPENQLSIEKKQHISVIPDVQTKFLDQKKGIYY